MLKALQTASFDFLLDRVGEEKSGELIRNGASAKKRLPKLHVTGGLLEKQLVERFTYDLGLYRKTALSR